MINIKNPSLVLYFKSLRLLVTGYAIKMKIIQHLRTITMKNRYLKSPLRISHYSLHLFTKPETVDELPPSIIHKNHFLQGSDFEYKTYNNSKIITFIHYICPSCGDEFKFPIVIKIIGLFLRDQQPQHVY